MARRETAAIIIQIRGGLKAAAETRVLAEEQDNLGDQVRGAGENAAAAAVAFAQLEVQIKGLARAEALATLNTAAMSGTLLLAKAAALGLAVIALPALVVAFGQVSAAALIWSTALVAGMGGVLAGAGLMAAGVIGRFQQMKDIVGSAAWELVGAAGALKETFLQVAATGADKVMRAIADALRGLLPLVRTLGAPLNAIAVATASMFRALGRELAGMGPELRALLTQVPGAITALGGFAASGLQMFVGLATVGLPLAISALQVLDGLMGSIAEWFTPELYQGAVSTLRSFASAVGDFFGAAAAPLQGVLGPAISEFGQAFMSNLRPMGLIVGTILAVFVQLGRAALPVVTTAIQMIAKGIARVGPALGSIDVGAIGKFLAGGLATVVGAIGKIIPQVIAFGAALLDALKPAAPLVTNVLWPLAKGIGKGVLGALKAVIPFVKVIATALGWLGEKARPLRGVFEGVGKILGFIFAGPILKGIGMLGKLNGVLGVVGKAAGAMGEGLNFLGRIIKVVGGLLGKLVGLAAKLLAPFVRFGVAVARFWVRVHLEAARAVLGVLGKLGALVSGAARIGVRVGATLIQGLRSLGGKMVDIGKSLGGRLKDGLMLGLRAIVRGFATVWNNSVGQLHFKVPGKIPGIGGMEFGIPKIKTDGLASGGVVMTAGSVWVGERGPELLNLPAGAHVTSARESKAIATVRHTPLVSPRGPGATATDGRPSAAPRPRETHITLKVGEKVLARAVHRSDDDDDGRNS